MVLFIIHSNKGFSLLEVIASMVIIAIILISFFSFFIQSKKVNVTSASIQDATYVAQITMEEIYLLTASPNAKSQLLLHGYSQSQNSPSCNASLPIEQSQIKETYVQTNQSQGFQIHRTIAFLCSAEHLSKVLIEVNSTLNTTKKATLENIYIWKK